jgi:DNA repair exonuclease SbcCD ATPase subunit
MATTDKLQKREKSRRVWRLNKKEGIPVMEALDSVGISKDVYYRIKNEHEDTWENEITTAEELEDKLEELKRKTEGFERRLEGWREEAEEAKEYADDLSLEKNWYQEVQDNQDKMIKIENLLQKKGLDITDVDMETFQQLQEHYERLEGFADDLEAQIDSLENRMDEIEENQQKLENKVFKLEARDVPESVFDLI